MYHLARNVLNDEAKKNKKHRQQDVREFEESITGGKQADEELHKTQEVEALQNAMNLLNEEYREVLILSRYQELKYSEIAQVLNTTEGNVKVKIHRALKQLQDIYFKVNSE
jgi:RNA polymerase sigma-70 factor (ECF subfamily)